ncbi:DAZ-associated protein 2-like [Tupaia chinensis]|uniref:DAZ-associated protein 2-like n=1 Tax=Tupaia chinensis TaxID=246437 RepID=UPI000FFC7680|nr:DAZ-associated protein 2-like [Tupaia chinensis]
MVNIQHSQPIPCSLLGIQCTPRPSIFLRLHPVLMLHLPTQSSVVHALCIQGLLQYLSCQLHFLAPLYLPMTQSVAVGPLGSTIPMAYYPVGPIYSPGLAVLVEGDYDAGVGFGAGATAGNIPPPPPGCPPNTAQLAVMQGANVLVIQQKGNFFMGGSGGVYTIW